MAPCAVSRHQAPCAVHISQPPAPRAISLCLAPCAVHNAHHPVPSIIPHRPVPCTISHRPAPCAVPQPPGALRGPSQVVLARRRALSLTCQAVARRRLRCAPSIAAGSALRRRSPPASRAVAQTLHAVAGHLCYALSLATRSGPFHRPAPYANSPLAPCAVPHRAPCATRALRCPFSSKCLALSYTPRLSPTLASRIRRTWVPLMMLIMPMRFSSQIAAADAVANAVSPRCQTCNRQYNAVCQHSTDRQRFVRK